jgi:hypothetical protein
MQTATTTAPPAATRPVERSSRLSNGVIPLFVIIFAIAVSTARRMRRRRAAEAGPREPSDPSP